MTPEMDRTCARAFRNVLKLVETGCTITLVYTALFLALYACRARPDSRGMRGAPATYGSQPKADFNLPHIRGGSVGAAMIRTSEHLVLRVGTAEHLDGIPYLEGLDGFDTLER